VLSWKNLPSGSPIIPPPANPTEILAAMKGLFYVVLSILLTILCWGVYGPVLKCGHLFAWALLIS
jgi:hypothetical protein